MHITTATSISAYMDLLATRSVQAFGSADAKSNESLYLFVMKMSIYYIHLKPIVLSDVCNLNKFENL